MAPVLRKTCVVKSSRGFFKIYISQAGHGVFWGSVVLDDTSGSWQAGNDAALQMKSKHFTGDSEKAALQQCAEWVKQRIDPRAVISEL
ncbi:MAG TPA: hypothetical protein VKU44_10870 [Terriglobia bacterium]|nr:hypothetical protein [Terriglobia bacterium]